MSCSAILYNLKGVSLYVPTGCIAGLKFINTSWEVTDVPFYIAVLHGNEAGPGSNGSNDRNLLCVLKLALPHSDTDPC